MADTPSGKLCSLDCTAAGLVLETLNHAPPGGAVDLQGSGLQLGPYVVRLHAYVHDEAFTSTMLTIRGHEEEFNTTRDVVAKHEGHVVLVASKNAARSDG
jgi:hypothetical protein